MLFFVSKSKSQFVVVVFLFELNLKLDNGINLIAQLFFFCFVLLALIYSNLGETNKYILNKYLA